MNSETNDSAAPELGCGGGLVLLICISSLAVVILFLIVMGTGGTLTAWAKDATGLDQAQRKAEISAVDAILTYAETNPRMVKYVDRYTGDYVDVQIPNQSGDGAETVMLQYESATFLYGAFDLPYSWDQWKRRNALADRAESILRDSTQAQLNRLKTINQ